MLPYWLLPKQSKTSIDLKKLLAQIQPDTGYSRYANHYEPEKPVTLTPFNFDPNTLDENGFRRLGLREKLIHTLLNYRNKGGKFYNKESLQKIYGLHPDEYKQLENFIQISKQQVGGFSYIKKEIKPIDINQADTTAWIQLNGIGSKLALNIIHYKEQLGGFVNISQVKEAYGMTDETFLKIKPYLKFKPVRIQTLNLNQATLQELNQHPYLKGPLARQLVDYRRDHDYKIDNLLQIKEIELINEEIFRKIVPYLSLQ